MKSGVKVIVDTRSLTKIARSMPGAVDALLGKMAGDMDGDVKDSFSRTAPDPAPPGAPPAVQTGTLKNSVMHAKLRDKVWVVWQDDTIAPWGKFLEFGTRHMAARPFWRKAIYRALRRMPAGIRVIVERWK